MNRHQNQISMTIFGEAIGENRVSVSSAAAILNFACKKNCSRVTKWHHSDLGSVWSVLPESPIKHCMYSKTHLSPNSQFCNRTMSNANTESCSSDVHWPLPNLELNIASSDPFIYQWNNWSHDSSEMNRCPKITPNWAPKFLRTYSELESNSSHKCSSR